MPSAFGFNDFRRGAFFACSVTVFGFVYVLLLPLAAYFTGKTMATFGAETPKLVAASIQLSPWLPLAIGFFCIGLLFWMSETQGTNRRTTYWCTTSVIVIGFLWLALTLLPAFQLMAALHN